MESKNKQDINKIEKKESKEKSALVTPKGVKPQHHVKVRSCCSLRGDYEGDYEGEGMRRAG